MSRSHNMKRQTARKNLDNEAKNDRNRIKAGKERWSPSNPRPQPPAVEVPNES